MFKTRDWIKRIIGVVKERVLLSVDRQAGLDCTRTALLKVVGRILELVVYVTSLTHSTTHQGVASRPTLHSLHWTDCTDKPGTGYVSTQGTLVLCSSTYTLAKSVWPFCPLILLTLNAKAV